MITKEEYLEWRSKKDFNTRVYYSFFLEHKSSDWKNLSLEEFNEKFEEFIRVYNGQIIKGTDGMPRRINYNNILNRCREYFDKKFNVSL